MTPVRLEPAAIRSRVKHSMSRCVVSPQSIGGISRCNSEIACRRNLEVISKSSLKHGRQGLFDEHVA